MNFNSADILQSSSASYAIYLLNKTYALCMKGQHIKIYEFHAAAEYLC